MKCLPFAANILLHKFPSTLLQRVQLLYFILSHRSLQLCSLFYSFFYSSFCIISINQSSHSSTISSITSSNFSFKLLTFQFNFSIFLNCFHFPAVFAFYLLVIVVVLVVVRSLSRVQLFAAPWTTAQQPSLSLTISWSLTKFTSIIYLLSQ